LHIAQQMPVPLTISCSSKSRLVLTFLVLPFWVVPDIFQKSSKMVVCVFGVDSSSHVPSIIQTLDILTHRHKFTDATESTTHAMTIAAGVRNCVLLLSQNVICCAH